MTADILPPAQPDAGTTTLALLERVLAAVRRCVEEGRGGSAELDDAFGRLVRSCGPVSIREVRLWAP